MTPSFTMSAPPTPCHVCAAPLPANSDRCSRCGALHAEFRRCEGCGALAEVVSKGGSLYVCAACGRPRIPLEVAITRSHGERSALNEVGERRMRAALWTGVGAASIALGIGGALVGALLLLAGATVIGGASAGVGITFVVLALWCFAMASRGRVAAEAAAREALALGAIDVMRALGPQTSTTLAAAMAIPIPLAESLLATLPARTGVRVDAVVDDAATDGLVRYRVADAGPWPAAHATPEAAALGAGAPFATLAEGAAPTEEQLAQADFDARLAAAEEEAAMGGQQRKQKL
jgi:hypothetical protein